MDELAGLEEHPLSAQYPCRVPVWWGRYGDVERDPTLRGVSGRKVVLRIPKQFGRIERWFARVLRAPKEVRRPLDTMISMLWELCDGSRTFADICGHLNDAFKENIAPVLHRTTAALHLLQSQNLLLMLDEPFAALDAQTRDLLLVEMQLIWEKTKKTILFVTHNVSEAAVLGTKVAIFSNRPSKIKKLMPVDFKRPRTPEDENLLGLQQEILSELRPEVKKTK